MDPKDVNLYVENSGSDGQQDAQNDADGSEMADAASALSAAANILSGRRTARIVDRGSKPASIASLGYGSKERIHAALQETLATELGRERSTLGLKPGDAVAISSSIGQSISF